MTDQFFKEMASLIESFETETDVIVGCIISINDTHHVTWDGEKFSKANINEDNLCCLSVLEDEDE